MAAEGTFKLKGKTDDEVEEATVELEAVLGASAWRVRQVLKRYAALGTETVRVRKAVVDRFLELLGEE